MLLSDTASYVRKFVCSYVKSAVPMALGVTRDSCVCSVYITTSSSGDPPHIPHLISTHQASGDCILSGLSLLTWNLEIDNSNTIVLFRIFSFSPLFLLLYPYLRFTYLPVSSRRA